MSTVIFAILIVMVGLEFYFICVLVGMADALREKVKELEDEVKLQKEKEKRLMAENAGFAMRAVSAERERDMAYDRTIKYERPI